MKILTARQIKDADKFTIENEPISSVDLMERAAKACFDQIKRRVRKQTKIRIFCGLGNNGGDGLAIARMVITAGYNVTAYKVVYSDKTSPDFDINEKRLQRLKRADLVEIKQRGDLPEIADSDVVIDAIFGTGLQRPLDALPLDVVQHINRSNAQVISVDIPSGLFSEDNSGSKQDNIIEADFTYTFQVPKLAFMFPENSKYVGNWQILDIGLSIKFIEELDTPWHFLQREDLVPYFRRRGKFDHKGIYGHALLVAGSYGKSGAAVLAAGAALKSGVGLLTTHLPKCNYNIHQTVLPECMVLVDEDEYYFSGVGDISRFSVIGAGPGLGQNIQSQNGLKMLIQNTTRPMVLDADALNIIAENPTWLSFLPPGSILTPHVGEMDRLGGKSSNSLERTEKACDLAFKYRCNIVLKGAHTAIISPDRQVIFNSTGNPGLAKGGSGDVLTGMILAYLAQGYSPTYSAMAGVYLHGLAADIAIRRKPMENLIASDVIENIGHAIRRTFY